MKILAIDPGSESSGVMILNGSVESCAQMSNELICGRLRFSQFDNPDLIAIEMVACYGMPVGKEVFETCVWIGRMIECASPRRVDLIYRKDIKMHLCHSMKAKDANIRQALIDRLGPPGTKKNPGATYGVSGHLWAALAVGVCAADFFKASLQQQNIPTL